MTRTDVIQVGETMMLPQLAQFQERILNAIGSGAAVALDLSRVQQIDLGFLQLVTAAREYAKGRSVPFALTAPAPEPVDAVLRRAGFLTDPGGDECIFWRHGADQ